MAWVVGSSHEAGVAADWLTSVWGQNAGIFQTSPAAAIAEEVCERWLLELLDLPRESSVGFVTGATMATFVGLAAARDEVLRRAGCDFDQVGLQGAPPVTIFISDDAHVANHAALRFLGFGTRNIIEVEATAAGVMDISDLHSRASGIEGPTIIIAQAGHVNTGAFDGFEAVAKIAFRSGAWLHVDGAFGLWARTNDDLRQLTRGIDKADSWAVDGHKWLQVPYDSGFAIVRDRGAHKRAMQKAAGYLNESDGDGRNPSLYNPELSRRARGFPVWAMLQTLGRKGIADMVGTHCAAARRLARRCEALDGVTVVNEVVLNQVALDLGDLTQAVCDRINQSGTFFLRTAVWRNRTILRVSMIGAGCDMKWADLLADEIEAALAHYQAARLGSDGVRQA
jgi:glutamate/tyrosine decarboxylase-like PLP-dependent enzyme